MLDTNTRLRLYSKLSCAVILFYSLAYILGNIGLIGYPYPDWWTYLTITLGSLLVPAIYGLFAFPAQWPKRRPGLGYAFFWIAALLGTMAVPSYFWLSRALSRMDCGNTCVGVPSDAEWVAMATVSLTLAVATPLALAYYRRLKQEKDV